MSNRYTPEKGYVEAQRRIKNPYAKNATRLDLSGFRLTQIPPELWELTQLRELYLEYSSLSDLPSEIGQLTQLTRLDLSSNRLTALPPEVGQLQLLQVLNLSGNRLTALPPEVGQLQLLQVLNLSSNRLTKLPPEVGQLTQLTQLDLEYNQLSILSSEIRQLQNLISLNLRYNKLSSLPLEVGQLQQLINLDIYGNFGLKIPPPEIVKQGRQAVLQYMRALIDGQEQWVSKLMLVGEGGVGKTSLLKNLLEEVFDADEDKTQGIDIRELPIEHPNNGQIMTLKAWDFGGQDQYLATHKFFLTDRCAFLLLWNARLGWEQGKIREWLKRIHASAPNAPILLVATHIDQNDAGIPFTDFQREFPNLLSRLEISNSTGQGIDDVYHWLSQEASKLPLMGVRVPDRWSAVSDYVENHSAKYITRHQFWEIMNEQEVKEDSFHTLAQQMHDLGEILFFMDDPELNNIVMLKPQWVADYIYEVLDDDTVRQNIGIFTKTDMARVWGDVDEILQDRFLRLMQKFDMSYVIPDDKEDRSLVVERLSKDEDKNYYAPWETIAKRSDCKEISMRFVNASHDLPGIPTWFIARSHRFTQKIHWRYGVLFGDKRENPEHLALVKTTQRDTQITVRGAMPHNFFALMRDGLEYTLRRFPGLEIERKVPCTGHNGATCTHEFDYEYLERAYSKGRQFVECPIEFEDIPLTELLYGLNYPLTEELIIQRIDKLEEANQGRHGEILAEFSDLTELIQRGFTTQFRIAQSHVDTECPNVFTLTPRNPTKNWVGHILSEKLILQLFCQRPGCWHVPVIDGEFVGRYEIDRPAGWMRQVLPYAKGLLKVMEVGLPPLGLLSEVMDILPYDEYKAMFDTQIEQMHMLVSSLDDLEIDNDEARLSDHLDLETRKEATGSTLRLLRRLLDEVDPRQDWGGLRKVLTPEGHYLWLCEHHAKEYRI